MTDTEETRSGGVEADDLEELAAELRDLAPRVPRRVDAGADDIEAGLAQLVLTLVELVRRLLEHQAVRRMEGGRLSDEEVEQLGLALMRLQERLDEIKAAFGLDDEDLNIDLGPLGKLV